MAAVVGLFWVGGFEIIEVQFNPLYMQILNQTQIDGLGNRELLKYSQLVGVRARKWKNHFVALLPEIARRGIYKKKFSTIVEFAAKIGGVGRKTVEAVFQVEKHIKDMPALKEILPEVGVNKVRVVATMATKENAEKLAEKVKVMSKSALEIYAREAKNLESPPGRNNNREYLGFCIDKEVVLEFRKFKQRLEKERKQKIDMNEVLKVLLEKVQEEPKRVRSSKEATKKITRYIPAAKKQELQQKYNGKCAKKSCNKPSEGIHHAKRFVLTKSHDNLKPLCKVHHDLEHYQGSTWADVKWLKYKLKFT